MARYEHRRYPSLVLHDGKGEWAHFSPETRTYGEVAIKVGVLDTDDPALIARLDATLDPDLVRADAAPASTAPAAGDSGAADGEPDQGSAVAADPMPDGTVGDVLAWVGGDADRAKAALAKEQASAAPRATLINALSKLAG